MTHNATWVRYLTRGFRLRMILMTALFSALLAMMIAKAEASRDGSAVNLIKPFRIDATAEGAWLINVSSATQYVFIDSQRQPAKLQLFDSSGSEVEIFDERAREKFDNMIHGRESFIPLPPGQRTPLLKIDLHRGDGYIELRAGPYRCGLRPGKYVAMVEWTSERNDYLDESERAKKHKAVWLGTVQSEKFELVVH